MQPTAELSYFDKRMNLLGITPEINSVNLWQTDLDNIQGPLIKKPFPIFTQGKLGIDILVYSIESTFIKYDPNAKDESEKRGWKVPYKITRLEVPRIKKDGSSQKYSMPPGQQTLPFFPPSLLEAFENKSQIKTLVLTEGYFKAFKAAMHGIPCVGLPSITCMKEKTTGKLHEEIKMLIETCKVERIIWLCDGDCIDITHDEIKDGKDLYKRPFGFFRSVSTFFDLLSGYNDLLKYFAYVNTAQIENNPKGLDDLLIELKGQEKEIAADLLDFTKIKEGWYPNEYFVKTSLHSGVGKVHKHFMLSDVDTFYLHHCEKRPDLVGKEFVFNGTLYKYDSTENKCKIIVPSDAGKYFRVGDVYHEFVNVPNKYGEVERAFHRRQKETIKDDHGKDIFKHIPKYKAFCIVPDHVNFQPVINGCFNIYTPFEHEPEEGTGFEETMKFFKHIFGSNKLIYKNAKTKVESEVYEYELGLDYLTLLYKKPQQVLPILCLVSTERQTGKTTFFKYLKMIFTGNMAVVGNQDLAADFNSHWASKLIVCCDETKIDKQVVVEKVKALSTSDRMMMNAKGRDQVEMEFFGKFIFGSNNEENFIYTDENEIRFWVRKVPAIAQETRNVNLLEDLQNEIPTFLHFLNTRKMKTEQVERHWFDSNLIKTEALKKVIQYSKPTIEKEIKARLKQKFLDFGQLEIRMPYDSFKIEILRGKNYEDNYLERILRDLGFKREPSQRGSYLRWEEKNNDQGEREMMQVEVKYNGRPFVFKREDFLNEEEMKLDPAPETMVKGELNFVEEDQPF